MSPLPERFTRRWDNPFRPSYDDTVCWHLLLGGNPAVQAAASTTKQRLAGFTALHMTPPEWLHVTVLRVGTAGQVTQDELSRMLARAQACLAQTAPVTVSFQRIFYHPEAITLLASPKSALSPILEAARTATHEVLDTDADDRDEDKWLPHLTLCYSATEQPAAPVIAALGKTLPTCEATITEMSLVVQDGPETLWNWQVAGSARLLGGPGESGD
jgi:2'-5' RNA ligase